MGGAVGWFHRKGKTRRCRLRPCWDPGVFYFGRSVGSGGVLRHKSGHLSQPAGCEKVRYVYIQANLQICATIPLQELRALCEHRANPYSRLTPSVVSGSYRYHLPRERHCSQGTSVFSRVHGRVRSIYIQVHSPGIRWIVSTL